MDEMKVVEEKFNALTDAQKWEVLYQCTFSTTGIENDHKDREECWKWFVKTGTLVHQKDAFMITIKKLCNSDTKLTFVTDADEFFDQINKYCNDWRGRDMIDSYLVYYTQKNYTSRTISCKTEKAWVTLTLKAARSILTVEYLNSSMREVIIQTRPLRTFPLCEPYEYDSIGNVFYKYIPDVQFRGWLCDTFQNTIANVMDEYNASFNISVSKRIDSIDYDIEITRNGENFGFPQIKIQIGSNINGLTRISTAEIGFCKK